MILGNRSPSIMFNDICTRRLGNRIIHARKLFYIMATIWIYPCVNNAVIKPSSGEISSEAIASHCIDISQLWSVPTLNVTNGNNINTLRPRQNYRHFADDIFKSIFVNENVWISIEISLKFVPKCQINNIPTLVQIMAWRRPGDKPLSEPMMVSSLTHICVSRPNWVNPLAPGRISCRLQLVISNITSWTISFGIILRECHRISVGVSQQVFGLVFGTVWKHAIGWTNVNQVLWRHH